MFVYGCVTVGVSWVSLEFGSSSYLRPCPKDDRGSILGVGLNVDHGRLKRSPKRGTAKRICPASGASFVDEVGRDFTHMDVRTGWRGEISACGV